MDQSPSRELLSIGAFSQASRLSQKALRLYGRQGLFVPVITDPATGYRSYHPEQLGRARLILLLRQMDLPLARIRRLLTMSPSEAADQVQTYCRERDAKARTEKRVAEEVIRCLHETYLGKGSIMSDVSPEKPVVTSFEAAPQLVIGISKPVKINGLQPHIKGSIQRLQAFAGEQPGLEIVGDPFGIFHGPVNSEDNGPMEVCLPVRGTAAPIGDIVLRELPGGPMATATGNEAQSDFPRVLEIYDAVLGWMSENGYAMAGPSREGWGERGHITVTWPYVRQ